MPIVISLDPAGWIRGGRDLLAPQFRTIRESWFPLLMSAWIVLIFAERLVVDYRLWGEGQSGSWADAIFHP